MWSNPCPRKQYVVIVLRRKSSLKIAHLLEWKLIKRREETRQLPHVVCSAENVDNYVARHRSNCMVKLCGRDQRITFHSFLRRCCIVTLVMDFVKSFSQFVCYSSVVRDELNAIYLIRNSGMHGPIENKNQNSKFDTQ